MKKTTLDFLSALIKASTYEQGSKGGNSYKSQFSLAKMVWFSHSNGFDIAKAELKSLCDCNKGVLVLQLSHFKRISLNVSI